jgi:hypothetical protein
MEVLHISSSNRARERAKDPHQPAFRRFIHSSAQFHFISDLIVVLVTGRRDFHDSLSLAFSSSVVSMAQLLRDGNLSVLLFVHHFGAQTWGSGAI